MNYILLMEGLMDSSIDLQEDLAAMNTVLVRAKKGDKGAQAIVKDVYLRLTRNPNLLESTCCHSGPTGGWPKSDLCSFCLDHSTFAPKEPLF